MAEKKDEILLESGTNEFEIVEFNIGDVHYGVNVAKVREVIARVPVTDMPDQHPHVDGLFTLRGKVVPLINLSRALDVEGIAEPKNIIVTEINTYTTGFLVDGVARIHRISWTKMEPAPDVSDKSLVVGIIRMEDRLILLLDFETIIADIIPDINQKFSEFEEVDDSVREQRAKKKVLVAEDSPVLRALLTDTLKEAGYKDIKGFANGQLLWEFLTDAVKKDVPLRRVANIVISDIEMPQMDGHRLLKLIRDDKDLNPLPIVFFSSLINEEMYRKGAALGATDQLSKPEIGKLINIVDDIVFQRNKE
jgi:two-component system chemotaxis response regulator CheV